MQKLRLLACSLMLLSGQAVAQAGGGNELVLSLYNQLETLQSEVQTLRGLVEEQAHQIRRLESDARERYMDLDQRLVGLSSAETAPGFGPAASGSVATPPAAQLNAAPNTAVAAGGSAVPAAALSDEELYRSALSLLLDQGDSRGASVLFQRYIDTHPDGRRLPNALYWQGEALILLADYGGARDMFERVLRDFPEDLKAAGAMLKLGVVYGHLGNRAQAEQTWRELPLRYPDSSSEIGLARDYLGQQR